MEEFTYSLAIPYYIDEEIMTSFDTSDAELKETLEYQIEDARDDAFTDIEEKIQKVFDDHLNELLDTFNLTKFEVEHSDTDPFEETMFYDVWTDRPIEGEELDELKRMLREWLNLDGEGRYDNAEFEGEFIGYEHGWNLPDSGGPPMYSDETANIIVSISTTPDTIEIEYEEEDDG